MRFTWGLLAAGSLAVSCLACGAAEMTAEKAAKFVLSQKAYADREVKEATAQVTQIRVALRSRRSPGDTSILKRSMSEAAARLARARNFKGIPTLRTFEVGNIGSLNTSIGNRYVIVELESEQLEVEPVFEGLGSSFDNGATFNTSVSRNGRNMIIRPDDIGKIGDDVSEFHPSGAYEVVGHERGKPILEPFDAAAAVKYLGADKPKAKAKPIRNKP
jgi:hypothetical protein